ncbi:hypothetical protein GCM10010168_45230 [Actinoplanes ianthinogenes]|uniref:Lipoprotein n=1 Tax=Actinoplanes ianthinogenes TaxID=122358 RepID=A0ABM7LPG7_9ACTN|nr:hypothetical protein [Actinoplanes ianthinogenes]BCJ41179.1 hypothetical protein Aiant_18360 [Actinoplanes ianthinogenes]GGR22390.1 hypothetical protein GCM10010168_45230 [Actinoplanes ianthinogenes]
MRRTILAVTAGALLLTGAACGSKSDTTATPAATTAATTVSATPAADYTADTKKVCTDVTTLLGGDKMKKFGEELGKLIAYKQAKATAKAKQARTDAGTRLKAAATELNAITAKAQDPELKAAGAKIQQNMNASAADDTFFAKFKTEADISKALETEMTVWFTPMDSFCS